MSFKYAIGTCKILEIKSYGDVIWLYDNNKSKKYIPHVGSNKYLKLSDKEFSKKFKLELGCYYVVEERYSNGRIRDYTIWKLLTEAEEFIKLEKGE